MTSSAPDAIAMGLSARSETQTALVERARQVFPAGVTNTGTMPRGLQVIVERGEGAELIDVDGRRVLDFVLGGGPLVLGHAHPRIGEAVTTAIRDGGHHFALHRRTLELAERLCDLVPSAEMVRFSGTGSEATFHALRLARAVTGRQTIIKFDGGYHGHHDLGSWSFEWTPADGTDPVPESAGIQAGLERDIVVLPFDDAEALRRTLEAEPDRFAAVIVEPIQRAIPASAEFLATARAACDRTGTVLVFDEIVTGFRCAPGGYQELIGVTPDLTALGKALGGGLPIAALVGRRSLMEHLDPHAPAASRSFHCGTFNGYELGSAAAHATLDVLLEEDGFHRLDERARQAGEAIRSAYADAGVPAVVLAGHGLFQHYVGSGPVTDAADVRATDRAALIRWHEEMLRLGVWKLLAKGYVSLVHDESHIRRLEETARLAITRSVVD